MKFEINFIVRDDSDKFLAMDKLHDTNIISLLSQFQLSLARYFEKEKEGLLQEIVNLTEKNINDDIPF